MCAGCLLTCCSLLVVGWLVCIARCLLRVDCRLCLSGVVCCARFGVCCVFIVCCVSLVVVGCVFFVVRGLLCVERS